MVKKQSKKKIINEKSYGVVPIHNAQGAFLFLLVHHKSGHWGLPKGHPEKGENEIETARREFMEETGVIDFEITEGPVFQERYQIENNGTLVDKTVKYFIARAREIRVTIQPQEIIGYGWFNYEDAKNMATFESTKRIISEAKSYADGHFQKIS